MKRKRYNSSLSSASIGVDTSKPTAVYRQRKPRPYTVSLALPGSIIANAQTHDLKTLLAGQIARTLAVFCVDEIVIFDDGSVQNAKRKRNDDPTHSQQASHHTEEDYTAFSDPSSFLNHILSYLETPPCLRRVLFPYHPNLKTAGSLPSLDMPHHLRIDEWSPYREGVTVVPMNNQDQTTTSTSQQQNSSKRSTKNHQQLTGPMTVTAGIPNPIHCVLPLDGPPLEPNTRLTLRFMEPYANAPPPLPSTPLVAEAVAPDDPREKAGYYWGYSVRVAGSLAAVFEEAPFDDGYDYSIGTSERGQPVGELLDRASGGSDDSNGSDGNGGPGDGMPRWRHLLVAFGGPSGLEVALKNDVALKATGVTQVEAVFDAWVNLVEGQGSRTIRTEEAVWIGMTALRGLVECNQNRWDHG